MKPFSFFSMAALTMIFTAPVDDWQPQQTTNSGHNRANQMKLQSSNFADVDVTPEVETFPTPETAEPPNIDDLGLTEEQKAKIKQIHENTRSKIERLLTTEQKAQLNALTKTRQPRSRQPLPQLNLSPEQEKQVRQLLQAEREQIFEVFTPAQQEQIEEGLQPPIF
ncbi:MAG TPA: hypothetical protein IGS53_27945 [Leptolyngbyaceae cyanobacterium M33_DOE_097]|uniref:P pilus assembly/Cpx signaling pathway, periplasmic inhibitor/zinc-resistance associated protein n=1 Tax=Oscillatoriales cyanobacterium SpSt-418 TaxID=2282169 RepID=A0A7C3PDU7_9CYAN|nr:hypothetical protein [Leptolyngbyaceae cyanobacterium M33_DOE_097]